MKKTIRGFLLAAVLLILTACGQVVTPEPTAEATSPASAPLASQTPTVRSTSPPPLTQPPATSTPTITPEPIVHVVQPGETLLSIAFDYGVSLQALQSANGIDNPQLLQVEQELVIPVGGEQPSTTPGLLLPTPTPLPFEVRGVSLHETPVGSLWCLGAIANTTTVTLTNVQVRVTILDAAGNPLTEADAFAAADIIPAGERSPFGLLFTNPPPDWASAQATILRGEEAGALADSYIPITVSDLEGEPADSQLRVSGLAGNASADQSAGSVYVIATTYDAEGFVTGFRRASVELDGPLTPGATMPFAVTFTFHGDEPADFAIIALGRVPAE